MKKRILACLMTVLILCSSVCAMAAPELASASACLMDAKTGQILYEKDAQTKRPMASITKVMTALLVIEEGDLTEETTATEQALATVDPASTRIGFVGGEQLTVDELMYCMLVYSANDAANVLAAYVDGDVETFVARMNEKAKELGCTNTHFVNPNGLDDEGHYSCAEDMARITRAANQHPEFAKYSSAVTYQLPADNIIPQGWTIGTKVNMLRENHDTYDARVYAAKTGWTTNAHNTFVACGKSDTSDFIVTVLNCSAKNGIFVDTTTLLNYGEQSFHTVAISSDDYEKQARRAGKDVDCKIDTEALKDISLKLPKDMTEKDLDYVCTVPKNATPYLAVMIEQDSRAKYTEITGIDGNKPLLRVPVTVENDDVHPSDSTQTNADGFLDGLTKTQRSVIWVGLIVIGAGILMLIIRFAISSRNKK